MPKLIDTSVQSDVVGAIAFVGIDPGVGGGLAVVSRDGKWANAIAMPSAEAEVWKWFGQVIQISGRLFTFGCIELVGGYVGSYNREEGDDGSKSNPGSAMFVFGQSYGALRMALVAAEIPFEAVRPQAWQKELGIMRTGEVGVTQWKNRLKLEAQRLFPDIKVIKKTADALLIAEYARRKWSMTCRS